MFLFISVPWKEMNYAPLQYLFIGKTHLNSIYNSLTNKKGTGVVGSESLNGSGFCPKPTGLKKQLLDFFKEACWNRTSAILNLPLSLLLALTLCLYLSLSFLHFICNCERAIMNKGKILCWIWTKPSAKRKLYREKTYVFVRTNAWVITVYTRI